MERLTGKALLAHYKAGVEAGKLKKDIIKEAGYVLTHADGRDWVQYSAFNTALLASKGLSLDRKPVAKPRGRDLSYRATVLKPGHAVIGRGYLRQIGAEPDSVLAIEVRGHGLIIQVADPVDNTEPASAPTPCETGNCPMPAPAAAPAPAPAADPVVAPEAPAPDATVA
jgi:hypothetical protein